MRFLSERSVLGSVGSVCAHRAPCPSPHHHAPTPLSFPPEKAHTLPTGPSYRGITPCNGGRPRSGPPSSSGTTRKDDPWVSPPPSPPSIWPNSSPPPPPRNSASGPHGTAAPPPRPRSNRTKTRRRPPPSRATTDQQTPPRPPRRGLRPTGSDRRDRTAPRPNWTQPRKNLA